MWRDLWPDRPKTEVPIDAITNGVHVPTWVEPKMKLLYDDTWAPGGWRTTTTRWSGSWLKKFRTRSCGRPITG